MHSQYSRRAFIHLVGGTLLGVAVRGDGGPTREDRDTRAARRRGAAFLARSQNADGAWRSTHYGFFRGGDAVTPLILFALLSGPSAEQEHDAISRGSRWLDAFTDRIARQEEPWRELRYPLFTASYAARYYATRHDRNRASVWADIIQSLQLTSRLGWAADDPRQGGWSDASVPPQRPLGSIVPDMLNPNISATAIAVLGLEAAGRLASARAAESFILRCQNLPAEPGLPRSSFDDGGFFFAIDDPARSKAGAAGLDALGRKRLRSYGSATCDGALALLALGHPTTHPRIAAALDWLRSRTSSFHHPGDWPADRADSARALLYYYGHSLGQLLQRCDDASGAALGDPSCIGSAPAALARGLMVLQSRDGSWCNTEPESCEDDPLVATAFALFGLRA